MNKIPKYDFMNATLRTTQLDRVIIMSGYNFSVFIKWFYAAGIKCLKEIHKKDDQRISWQ